MEKNSRIVVILIVLILIISFFNWLFTSNSFYDLKKYSNFIPSKFDAVKIYDSKYERRYRVELPWRERIKSDDDSVTVVTYVRYKHDLMPWDEPSAYYEDREDGEKVKEIIYTYKK